MTRSSRVIGRPGRGPARARGLTLIECLWAIVILPLAVTAISYAVVAGQTQAVAAMTRVRAAQLASALLEEIVALPYDDPDGASGLGPEGGESARTAFDNGDDFHGFTESAGSLKDATDTLYAQSFQPFARAVACSLETITVTGLGTATDGLEVTVTVTKDGDPVVAVTRFIPEPP